MTAWLVDKSALWKLPQSRDYETWINRINRGQVWISLPTRLEVGVSAREPEHWPTLREQLLDPLLDAQRTPRSEVVALEIMEALIEQRLHRSTPLPDVMIASIAVAQRLTVLHHDRDFDRIRDAYGGPDGEWLNVHETIGN